MRDKYPSKMNERAQIIVQKMQEHAHNIGVISTVAGCGATIIDAGINAPGSPEAGRLYSLICLGGTAHIELDTMDLGEMWLPSVTVRVEEPVKGCMASQYAGWLIKGDSESPYFAMGSGPARALYGAEEIFRKIGNTEKADVAILALETRQYPPDSVLEYISQSCGVNPKNLTVILAPTASIVGSIQVASRIVETGLHKLFEIGFDINCVMGGWGKAPIAPVAMNDGLAIGWTNDGILYGGRSWYTVDCEDEQIERILSPLPACSSSDYGTPFFQVLQHYEWDFYKIDPMLFSPAVIYINNVKSGRTYRAGVLNTKLLEAQWLARNV